MKIKLDENTNGKDRNGVVRINSKLCATNWLPIGKKEENTTAIFEEVMMKHSHNLRKTPLQRLKVIKEFQSGKEKKNAIPNCIRETLKAPKGKQS